jgi:hypothetical protein
MSLCVSRRILIPARASCSASAAFPCCERTLAKGSRGSTKSWLEFNRGSKVRHRRIRFALLGENPPQRRLRLRIIGSEPYSLLETPSWLERYSRS